MLTGANTSRTFFTQAKLPELTEHTKGNDKTAVTANKLIRTDRSSQKLHKFFQSPSTNPNKSSCPSTSNKNRRDIQLRSVLNLLREIEEEIHVGLSVILFSFTFVGCIDQEHALIQHLTNLYICNTRLLAEEMFYQILQYNLVILESLSLRKVSHYKKYVNWQPELGSKAQLATDSSSLLLSKAEMLQDYFSIEIDSQAKRSAIPMLLVNYVPDFGELPLCILRVASEVNWTDEQKGFQTFCRETAKFYSSLPKTKHNVTSESEEWPWIVEHVIYPTLKASFLPPRKSADDKTIIQIASLPELNKVFERC